MFQIKNHTKNAPIYTEITPYFSVYKTKENLSGN